MKRDYSAFPGGKNKITTFVTTIILRMKKILLGTFMICNLLVISSCRKDKNGCTDQDAINFDAEADSNDGTCSYIRDKYVGNYEGFKICQIYTSDSAFVFSISPSIENSGRLIMNEFPESGASIYANLDFSDSNKLIIPNQTLENGLDVSEISGNGLLINDSLLITYYRFVEFGGIDTSIIQVKRR